MKAKIDGSPMPEISWYKDGEKIVPDEHTRIEILPDGTTKLIIDCVQPLDCGAYKLVINNSTGEQSSLCAVAIKRERQFTRFISSMSKINSIYYSCYDFSGKEEAIFLEVIGGREDSGRGAVEIGGPSGRLPES